MTTLRPSKDKRSISMNDMAATSTSSSKRPLPTPFLRQTSVVEVMEKKQREGLKNRLKMLHTGVLPSRNVVSANPSPPSKKVISANLPVIVKAPVGKVTLPKNPPRKAAHYRSVLNLTTDNSNTAATNEGGPSRLTRRHSIGALMGVGREKERSSSDTIGREFRSDNLYSDRLTTGSGYKGTNNTLDSRHHSDPDKVPIVQFQIAKDDSDLNKDDILLASKTQSQILTHSVEDETSKSSDAKMNGNCKKHDNDDDVFSLQSRKDSLDENLNIQQSSYKDLKGDHETPDIDHYLVNGHQEVITRRTERIGDDDIIYTTKTIYLTDSERPRVNDELWMSDVSTDGSGETRFDEVKERRPLFTTDLENSILVDVNESLSESPSHEQDSDDERRSEKTQQHHIPATTTTLTTYPHHFESPHLVAPTETRTTFEREDDNKKAKERPVLNEDERWNASKDKAISQIKAVTASDVQDSSDGGVREQNRNAADRSKDETDTFWSAVEDSFRSPVEAISNKSHSQLIDFDVPTSSDFSLSKHHRFSYDSTEANEKDENSGNKSDDPWKNFEDTLISVQTTSKSDSEPAELNIQKTSDKPTGLGKDNFSDELKETKRKSDALWSAFVDSLAGPVELDPDLKSLSKSFEVEVKNGLATGLDKHYLSDDLKETIVNDEGSLRISDASWPAFDDSLTSPVRTSSYSESTALGVQMTSDVVPGKYDLSNGTKDHSRNDDDINNSSDTLWSTTEQSLKTTSSTSLLEPIAMEAQNRPDSHLRKHDDVPAGESKDPNKKNEDKLRGISDGFRLDVEDSFTGSVQASTTTTTTTTTTTSGSPKSRSELIEVEVQKCPDAGLGFCIEGGRGTPSGDRPVTVKRVFNEATHRCLKEGDEILTVGSTDTSTLTHIDAWKLFKSLPEGSVKMTVIRHRVE